MASNLRVDQITASTAGSVSIGTATFTGGLSGSITGLNVTGVITATTLNQNVSGILTAQNGIHVTGGSVGIGTDNSLSKLNVLGTQGNWRVDTDTVSSEIQVLTSVPDNSGFRNYRVRTNETIFDTNGSERLRITSTGNVGIGTDNPTVFGTAYRTLQLNPAAGTGDGSAIRFMYDGGTANTNDLVIYTNSSQSYIRANGARNLDIMRNGSTVATFNANGIALPSGLGIDFSATADGSGTTNSELFDDYEEGSFTPEWGDGSSAYSSPAPTYSTQRGDYTKVGNVVYYDIHLITTAWNSAGNTMWPHGLPFTTRSSGYQQGGGGIFCILGVDDASAISNLTTQIATSTTRVELYFQNASTGANYSGFGINHVNENGTVSIRISGFYFTDS